MRSLVDALLGPLTNLLSQVATWLEQAALMAERGFDLSRYLGYVAWLPPAWMGLVKQVTLAAALVGIVAAARAGWGLYLRIKASVQWW